MPPLLRHRRPAAIERKFLPEGAVAPRPGAALATAGMFQGYASLFNVLDLGKDIMLPGAFTASLAARGAAGVRMLWQHDPAQPIGVWLSLVQDGRGLFARGRLELDVARAREVHALMRDGAVDGLSIGYRAEKASRDPRSGIRRVARVDLWEISIVTFPMLPQARVSAVKSVGAFTSPLAGEVGFAKRSRVRGDRVPPSPPGCFAR